MAAGKRELLLDLLARDKTKAATDSAARNLDDVADAADDAAKSTEKFTKTTVVAGDELDDLGKAARDNADRVNKLNREIGLAENELNSLARAFADTDDAAQRLDLSKAVRRLENDLRRLNKNKKTLEGLLPKPAEVAAAASKVGKTIGTKIGESTTEAVGSAVKPMIPVLAGVAVAAAPIIGATISAAIIGGAGLGGVVGGVMLAARDQRVAQAGTTLSKVLLEDLESRAKVFVEPVLKSVKDITRGFSAMGEDLDRIFTNSAKFVAPLTQGLLGFTQQITGGIADLTDAAGPVMDVLSNGLAELGDAIGDVFSDLSDNGVDAAVALNAVFQALEGTIRAVGAVVNGLTEAFGFLAKVGAFGKDAQQEYLRLEMNANLAAEAGGNVATSLGQVKSAGAATAGAIKGLVDAMGDLNEENRTLYGSETDVAQALADTSKAIKENGNTLDVNTQKGRDNRQALENLATTLAGNLEAFKKVNGEGPRTDAVAESNRQAFIKLATKLTNSKEEAIKLANKLLGIPSVSPKITVRGVDGAKAAAKTIKATLRAIKDETVNIIYKNNYGSTTSSSALRSAYNKNAARAEGGPVKRGNAYVVGEKRPEVFVPDRDGQIIPSIQDYARGGSMGAGWSGGGRSGGTATAVQTLRVDVTGAEGKFKAWIRELYRTGQLP